MDPSTIDSILWTLSDAFFGFVFIYPAVMCVVWIIGSLMFRVSREDHGDLPPEITGNPLVSVIIPCHNEEDCVENTIRSLARMNYPNFEIIAVNDHSLDRTGEILAQLQKEYPFLRVVTMTSNQGKAAGMTMAALISRGEYLVTIDADALLDPDAVRWFLHHFEGSPRVGAITGNPKIRNRTTLLAKIQVGEYATIVGMIKRAERILGKLYTVSGVVVAFRKKALASVGFWSNNMVTDDIDVSWKIQLDFWDVRYETRAICWILVPETLSGLFRQRLRWNQGGNEVLIKYRDCLSDTRAIRLWPLYFEQITSVIWSYFLGITVVLYLLHFFVTLPPQLCVSSFFGGFSAVILTLLCVAQMLIGISFESKQDHAAWHILPWIVWYPVIYWVLNCVVTLIALPKALLKKKTDLAIWKSPDRGL